MAVKYVATSKLPTHRGDFEIHAFEDPQDGKEHVALSMGDFTSEVPVLIRLHSECLTGDALFSQRCDCGPQLEAAMSMISEQGNGLILYLRQEGRGIGLVNKIRAYQLQDQGADTVEANEQLGFDADYRDYSLCKDMLEHFGIKKIRLLTNNPRKIQALEDMGFEITERVPLHVGHNSHNAHYLDTKRGKLGHMK